MRILAVDPGLTTGVAVLGIDDNSLRITDFVTEHISFDQLPSRLAAYEHNSYDYIIVERLPYRLNARMLEVSRLVTNAFPIHQVIAPAEWKPVTGKTMVPFRSDAFHTYTDHERDAYRIGLFWLHGQRLNRVRSLQGKVG